jgi:hypothetical protein
MWLERWPEGKEVMVRAKAKTMLRRRLVTRNHLLKALGTEKGTIKELEAAVAATEGADARAKTKETATPRLFPNARFSTSRCAPAVD